jgi:hypothetical protein
MPSSLLLLVKPASSQREISNRDHLLYQPHTGFDVDPLYRQKNKPAKRKTRTSAQRCDSGIASMTPLPLTTGSSRSEWLRSHPADRSPGDTFLLDPQILIFRSLKQSATMLTKALGFREIRAPQKSNALQDRP